MQINPTHRCTAAEALLLPCFEGVAHVVYTTEEREKVLKVSPSVMQPSRRPTPVGPTKEKTVESAKSADLVGEVVWTMVRWIMDAANNPDETTITCWRLLKGLPFFQVEGSSWIVCPKCLVNFDKRGYRETGHNMNQEERMTHLKFAFELFADWIEMVTMSQFACPNSSDGHVRSRKSLKLTTKTWTEKDQQ